MPEILEIKYPNGLVGPGPRKIAHGGTFRFTCSDPGTVELEFKGKSPLADGKLIVGPDTDFTAATPGNYHFDCTLITPAGETLKLKGGGELEITPG